MMQKLWNGMKRLGLNREIILYLVFGVMTTIINYVVFALSLLLMGQELYLVGNVTAFFAAVLFAYVTNKLIVFSNKTHTVRVLLREILSFFAARLLTFGFEELGLFLLVSVLHWSDFTIFGISGTLIAKIGLSFLTVIANYGISKYMIFRK